MIESIQLSDHGVHCAWMARLAEVHTPRRLPTPSLCVRLLPAIPAHRIATHLDAVSVVDQPVRDSVGQGRIANLLVPAGHWQLRRENQ
jgi:hypothetical protein